MTTENTPTPSSRTRSNMIVLGALAVIVALVVGVIVWASSSAPADGAAAPVATASTAPGDAIEHDAAPGDSIDDTSATPTPTPTPTTTAEQQELYDLMLNADPDTLERDLCGSDLLVLMGLGPVKPHPGYAAEGIVQYLWSPYLVGTDLYVEYHLVDGVAVPVDDTVVIYPDECEVPAAELAIR